ncbi:MAG: hypothetical protein WA152_00065 [Microgenomates group bacterium]
MEYRKNNQMFILNKGDKLNFSFYSNDINLGSLLFLFDNHNRINKDVLSFKIREKGSDTWYHSSLHETSKMNIGQFYPIGFPIITESKGRNYEIELESLYGTVSDGVSLSNNVDYFIIKHNYSRSFLKNNPKLIPHFLYSTSLNVFSHVTVRFYVFIFTALLALSVFIYKVCKLLYIVYVHKLYNSMSFSNIIKFLLNDNYYIWFVLGLYLLTRIGFLSYSQYWDANWYWTLQKHAFLELKNASDLSSSFSAIASHFNFLGHPSMGYVGIIAIGQLFGAENVIVLNTVNMILAIISIWAFNSILYFFYPKQKFENTLVSFIYAFNPLFYATSISMNLDFPLLVFTTLMVESYVYKRKILFIIWSLLLIFTKETGIVIYSLFFAINLVSNFTKHRLVNRKFNIVRLLYFFVPIVFFCIYFIYAGGKLWNSNDYMKFDLSFGINCQSCLGINLYYIKIRLFQIFVMNFSWVLSIIILSAMFNIYKNNSNKNIVSDVFYHKQYYWISVSIFFSLVLFNLFVVVMSFPRYVVYLEFFKIILLYLSVCYLFPKKIIYRRLIFSIICILTFIQVFKSFDPSSRILFGTSYLGRNVSSNVFASPNFGYHDSMVYNSQFVFIDGLSKTINKDTPSDMKLINDVPTSYFWKNINFVGKIEDLKSLHNYGYEKLRYVYVPWMSYHNDVYTNLNNMYDIVDSKFIDYDGYYVETFDLEIRKNSNLQK